MSLNEVFEDIPSKLWKQKIQFELNGLDYQTLIWKSPEDISVRPFYHFDENFKKHSSPPRLESLIRCQKIYVADVEKTIEKINKIALRGVNGFWLIIPDETKNIHPILEQCPANVHLYIECLFLSETYYKNINPLNPNIQLWLVNDPIFQLTHTGNWFKNKELDFKILNTFNTDYHTPILSIRTSHYQNAGANIIQQLAFALAQASEYFHHLENLKSPILIEVAIGGNFFFEIAKLKALRLLFASLSKEFNLPMDCQIIAIPSKRNKTLFTHENNLVRTTTEDLSAVLGNTDAVISLPADFMFKKENGYSNHLANNQLLILEKETDLYLNHNPTEGNYYLDYLTHQMIEKSLLLFKEIERKGGFLALLKSGWIQHKIKESALKEQEVFNQEKEIIIGANKHLSTDQVPDLELYPFVKNKPRKTLIIPIVEKRLSEEIEKEILSQKGLL